MGVLDLWPKFSNLEVSWEKLTQLYCDAVTLAVVLQWVTLAQAGFCLVRL